MKRIIIIVEGQTEAEFFKRIVFPYLYKQGIKEIIAYPAQTSIGHKGGNQYSHIRNEIQRILKRFDNNVIVSTFFDYYGLHSFPKVEESKAKPQIQDRVRTLEQAIAEDLNDNRLLPYIQLHEFEALLFSSSAGFRWYHPEILPEIKQITEKFPNPELINDHPDTAPSKRILRLIDRYNKVVEGVEIAEIIGMETIMDKCPRFRQWIETLIRIACLE
jgi:hypothetical protein